MYSPFKPEAVVFWSAVCSTWFAARPGVHSAIPSQDDTDEEVEKDNFTPEEFDKACEDLGLENCGEESSDEDDFFQRLNQIWG